MKFEVNATLQYYIHSPGTLIINIHALRTQQQVVLKEELLISPDIQGEELVTINSENRLIRIDVPFESPLTVRYSATVDNAFKFTDHSNEKQLSVSTLDPAVFPFLNPSRYCQSDKLYRLANNKFGKITNPYQQVSALTEWIHKNVEYLSGSTNAQTSAYDTVTEQAGVCRDFAHLGIALCRALTIPARYFTGYAYQLQPPDFHGCFEAYLGGDWVIFDATKLAPLNGLVKIATGRDAADTAIGNIFGNVTCYDIKVSSELREPHFHPFFYEADEMKGLSYL